MTKASLLKAAARQLELDPEGTIGVIEPGQKRPWSGYGKAWQTKWHRDLDRLADEIDRSGATHLGYHPGPHVAVVDVDHPDKLLEELPATHRVRSQSGGPGRGHSYFRVDDDVTPLGTIPGGAGEIRRHGGGQVVFAGPGYKAAPGEFADLPEWLTRDSAGTAVERARDTLEWDNVPPGQQNNFLTAQAGSLRRQGASPQYMLAVLEILAEGMELGDPNHPWTREDLKQIVRSVSRYEPDPDRTYEVVDETDEGQLAELGDEPTWEDYVRFYGLVDHNDMDFLPPPEWWWKPYIPKGRLVLVDGDSGIGKGLFCVHVVTRLVREGARVLWASTEDDPEEDIQRRLAAAGLEKEPGRIHFFTKDPRFPDGIEVLEAAIAAGGIDVIILDPGRSFLAPPPGTPMSFNDDHAVRYGLEAIQRMAKRACVTILFVHHWNKDTQQGVRGRQTGSAAFTAVPRHRIALAWHGPSDGGSGAFEVAKSNIGPTGAVHGYTVEEVPEHDTAKFVLGDVMPEYQSLGSWMKAMEKEDKPIQIDMSDQVREAVLALNPGTKIVDANLAVEAGTSTSAVADVLVELLEEGVLRKGPRGVLVRNDADRD